jgi:hypothetical protein
VKGSNLSTEDPWATAPAAPAEEAQQAPESTAPVSTATVAVKPVIVGGDEGKLTLTFKGAGGYGDRWIVAHVANPSEGLALLNDPEFKELLDLSKRIAAYDGAPQGGAPQGNAGGGQPAQQQSRAPQGATQAPNGETRSCSHGQMVFKSGVSKAGNAYKLFSCTAPRDQQCKAQYLRD